MTITFNQIPASIGVPGQYVEFDGTGARTAVTSKPVRILVYGQMLATGLAVPDVPILVSNTSQAVTQFGRGSMLADMLNCHFKVNSLNEVWVVPQVDDGDSVKALFTVTISGTSAGGVFPLYVAGRKYNTVVTSSSTATTIAAALAATINDDFDATFTATSTGGELSILFRHGGELGNDLQINNLFYNTDVIPAGLSVVIAQDTEEGIGAVNPDVSASIAATASGYYSDIIFPYTDQANMALIEQELDDRWSPLPNETSLGAGQNDAHLWQALRGSQASLLSWKETRNNQHVTTMSIESGVVVSEIAYVGMMSPSWIVSAVYGATGAYYSGITPNGNLQNIAMGCLQPAPHPARWTWNERNQLILGGFATYKYDNDGMGNGVVLERATTNKTKTVDGLYTDAERDTETQKLNSYLRWSVRQTIATKYPRHRLASDSNRVSRQKDVTTPKRVAATIVELAGQWSDLGYIENYEQFKKTLVVERSTLDCNTIGAIMSPDHVNQFRVFAGQIGYIVC